MAIDLGSGNTTRYYKANDHDDLSLPNADWSWITCCYWPSGQITSNAYYIVSTGTVQTANSFNLFLGTGLNQPSVIVNTADTLPASALDPAPKDQWMVFYATRRSNSLYVGRHVLGEATGLESFPQPLTAVSNGSGLWIGSRNDLNTARFWSGRIGYVSFVPGYGVTQDDVASLANGAPLFSMPFAQIIKFLFHPRTAEATVADLISGKVATRFGSSYGANEEDIQTPYIWLPSYIRGTAATSAVTGTVAYTNLNDTSAATGTTTVTGSSATTNANDTSAAQGTTTVTGSSATTNANDTSTATGSPVVDGVSATTNADDISSASGAVGSAIVGTVDYTNTDDVSAAVGTTTVVGTGASENVDDVSSASGTTTVIGTSATTNTDDTSAAVGEVGGEEITGTVAYTNIDDVSAASGTTTIIGSSVTTNTNDQSAAYGIVNNGTIVEAALTSGTATTVRIKKPGIPVGTPDWLKTMTEIMTGRRGNKIEVPKFQALEFSATPTKAEVEALYAYTNKVRDSLDQLINRFDS